MLSLSRPLAFIDLESTGTDVVKDRIVEIGVVIIHPDNTETEHHYVVNPGIPIPVETSKIHGIYDKDVADKPSFKDIAKELFDLVNPCDIGGFNSNRFDVPMLAEEFLRVDMVLSVQNRNLIDVRNIFVLMEKRNLEAAYKFYCDKQLVNAHSAMADTKATAEVFKAQMARYEDLQTKSMNDVFKFSNQHYANQIDFAGRIVNKGGRPVFNFGKYKGKYVSDVLEKDPGYYNWMQNSDFPLFTKMKLKEIKLSLK